MTPAGKTGWVKSIRKAGGRWILFTQYPESVSVREGCICKAATMLIILMVYQRVANTADAPLSGAPQGGGVNPDDNG